MVTKPNRGQILLELTLGVMLMFSFILIGIHILEVTQIDLKKTKILKVEQNGPSKVKRDVSAKNPF